MVSSSSWRFRAAADTAAEAERFTALSNSLYARPVTPAYYRWQFHQPPFPSELTLAEGADQTLAGAYAFHHREANDSHSLAMALDIMITPAAQGTGLFRQLYQAAVERARGRSPSALYVMANQRAAAVHAGALGWSQVQTFRDYVAPTTRASGRTPLEWSAVASPGEAEDRLLRAAVEHRRAEGLLVMARHAAWLRWRFLQNPRYRYQVLRGDLRGTPYALLVLKTFTDPVTGQSFGDIVDLAWTDSDPALLRAAIEHGLGVFAAAGLTQASMWLQSNSALDAAGLAVGFTVTKRERFLLALPQREEAAFITRPGAWFTTMADAEVY